jgi:predicted MFS family arabinose efflux permease
MSRDGNWLRRPGQVTGQGRRILRRFGQLPGWLKVFMAGQFLNAAGAVAWLYLTLYLVSDRHLDPAHAGLVAAAYGAGLLLGNLFGGAFGDRFGMRRCVVISLTSWAVLCVAMPFVPASALAPVGGLAGACVGAARPLGNAMVATALPGEQRRAGIALSRTAINAGFVVGPPLGALLITVNFSLVFFVDAGSSLLLAALVWLKLPAGAGRSHVDSPHITGLWRELSRRPSVLLLVFAVLIVDTVYRQLFISLPLLLHDTGAPAIAYGLLVAFNAILIVLAEAPLAVALGRYSAIPVITAGFVLVALGFLVIAGWPVLGGAVVAMVVITAGEMLYKPTATAHVVDAAPEGMAGRFASLYAGASIGGVAFGSAAGGALYQHLPGLLWTIGALAVGVAAVAAWLAGRLRTRTELAART